MGIDCGILKHFYTSSQATAMYLQRALSRIRPSSVWAPVPWLQELRAKRPPRGDRSRSDAASVVLIGFDTENTSEKIREYLHHAGTGCGLSGHQPGFGLSRKLWFHPGLRFHEHHAQKCDRQNTVFHRQARTDHDRLCFKKARHLQRGHRDRR